MKLGSDILSFRQMDSETLYNAWELYKELLRKYPQHRIVEGMQIQIFYNGLNVAMKQMLDAAAKGSLHSKQPNIAQPLIEDMTSNGYQWSVKRNEPMKVVCIYGVDTLKALVAQVRGWT